MATIFRRLAAASLNDYIDAECLHCNDQYTGLQILRCAQLSRSINTSQDMYMSSGMTSQQVAS
eukprot:scaffold1254_cov376-Prasinococcus_capsulatus_cf.AAC.2